LCPVNQSFLSEKEAHRFIEKQAKDTRSTKREIAGDILKTYDTQEQDECGIRERSLNQWAEFLAFVQKVSV